jgi:DNA-directed RNA polymerase subunit RPC12/RpoP
MRKVRCDNCGYEWMENVEKIYEDGQAPLTRGRTKPAQASTKTEKYVDLVCPNCKKEFEFSWEE